MFTVSIALRPIKRLGSVGELLSPNVLSADNSNPQQRAASSRRFYGRLDPRVVTEPANLLILGQKSWFCCPECAPGKKASLNSMGVDRETHRQPARRDASL